MKYKIITKLDVHKYIYICEQEKEIIIRHVDDAAGVFLPRCKLRCKDTICGDDSKVTNEMTWQTISSPRFHSMSLPPAPCHSSPRGEIFQRGVTDTAYGVRPAFEIACLATREMVRGVSSNQRISRVVIISGADSPSWHELTRPQGLKGFSKGSFHGQNRANYFAGTTPERGMSWEIDNPTLKRLDEIGSARGGNPTSLLRPCFDRGKELSRFSLL